MKKVIIALMLTLFACTMSAQRVSIVLDGNTADWNAEFPARQDALGDGADIDITSLKVTNDSEFLYLSFTLQKELLLNADNNLWLYLDTDNNAATGTQVHGIGADLRWHFGGREGWFKSSEDKVYHNEIGLVALPTVTSDTFEVRIDRNAKLANQQPVFPSKTIKVLLKDGESGDAVPDAGTQFEYTFANQSNDFQPRSLMRASATDIRIMSYNVLHDGIIKEDRKPYFRRIIRASNPDVLVLNECWDATAEQVRAIFNEFIPLAGGASWNALKKDNGNVLVSRYPFIESWRIHEGMRLTAALIDLPDDRFSSDFLVVGAHFRCCGANDKRQREADAFIEFILDAKTTGGRIDIPQNTPFFMAGDLNLVGDAQQLETILTGDIINEEFGEGAAPDWDHTPLLDVISTHTDEPIANTWRSNKSSYWPGRLDFTIISNSVCKVLNAWTLETNHMSPERLNAFNLEAQDTRNASDHLPKVTDLMFIGPAAVTDIGQPSFKVVHNPVNDVMTVVFEKQDVDSIKFIELATGKMVKVIANNKQATEQLNINTSGLSAGVYLLKISDKQGKAIHYEKVVITN